MNYVDPDLLDGTLEIMTGEQYWLQFHTGNPEGASGLHESTGLLRQEVPPEIWGLFFNHSTSGRASANDDIVNFGQSSAAENLSWAVLWSSSSGGTVRATRQLVVPIPTNIGTLVIVPASNLRWRAYPGTAESEGDGS